MTFPSFSSGSLAEPVAERVAAVLERIRGIDPALRAFTEIDAPSALARARELDALPPESRGPLHGWPIGVKEVFDVRGMHCAWGSPLHADRVPAVSAPMVARLIAAGAVIIGLTASTEYALAAMAATTHPRDPLRSPGASSSGSAAAVGAGLVPLALATQTIGSIVRPAAFCGTVGYKPTLGRYSTSGMLSLSPRLDHAGLIGDCVDTILRADGALGVDDAAPPSPSPLSQGGVAIIAPWFSEAPGMAMQGALARVARRLQQAGAGLRTVEVPRDIAAMEEGVTDTLLTYDLAAGHGDYLRRHRAQVSDRLMAFIDRGMTVSADAYAAAAGMQDRIAGELQQMLLPGEIGLAPPTLDIAPLRRDGTGSRGPQRLWTLTGMPAITLPAGEAQGMPLCVQLIGRRGEDALLLQRARQIEALLKVGADG